MGTRSDLRQDFRGSDPFHGVSVSCWTGLTRGELGGSDAVIRARRLLICGTSHSYGLDIYMSVHLFLEFDPASSPGPIADSSLPSQLRERGRLSQREQALSGRSLTRRFPYQLPEHLCRSDRTQDRTRRARQILPHVGIYRQF
jgi:hypothetical protein